MHPDAQRKAQAELDAVIGPNRLPRYADRSSLPYINAVVKESLRWQPVTPLGGPHKSTADDEYRGWFIPKGTIVIANQWYANSLYVLKRTDFKFTNEHWELIGPSCMILRCIRSRKDLYLIASSRTESRTLGSEILTPQLSDMGEGE